MCNNEQIINGFVRYIDNEVIPKLDTKGKWIIGAMSGMIGNKALLYLNQLSSNELLQNINVINENGLFDVDSIGDNLVNSANKYGNLQLNIPAVGVLTFNANDIDTLKRYVKGEM